MLALLGRSAGDNFWLVSVRRDTEQASTCANDDLVVGTPARANDRGFRLPERDGQPSPRPRLSGASCRRCP